MKAERRHELKTNTLALALQRLPELWRQYGTRILVGLLVVVGGFVAVQQWTRARSLRVQSVADNLAIARTMLVEIQQVDMMRFGATPEELATARRLVVRDAESAVNTVLREATEPAVRAEALVYRGDLYWHMANLARLPGEDEDPELRVDRERSRDELLSEAERAWQEVVQRYPDQTFPAVSARFGLAAIAENRRQWDQAEIYYRQVIDQPDMAALYRQQAEMRLTMLETIRQPVYFGQPLALDPGPDLDFDALDLSPLPSPPGEAEPLPPDPEPAGSEPEASEAPPATPEPEDD